MVVAVPPEGKWISFSSCQKWNQTRRGASCAMVTRKRLIPKCETETDVTDEPKSIEPRIEPVEREYFFTSSHHRLVGGICRVETDFPRAPPHIH